MWTENLQYIVVGSWIDLYGSIKSMLCKHKALFSKVHKLLYLQLPDALLHTRVPSVFCGSETVYVF